MSDYGRICIVLLRGIGDVVLALPVAAALKRYFTGCTVTWVVHPLAAPLLDGHREVDQVIAYDPKGGWKSVRALRREVSGKQFDLLMCMGIYLHALPPVLLIRAVRKLGFGRGIARDLIWLFFHERISPDPGSHTGEKYAAFLDHLGVPRCPHCYELSISPAEEEARDAVYRSLAGGPRVAMVVCAGRPEKDWPAERYAAVAQRVTREFNASVFIVGGPSQREADLARTVAHLAGVPVQTYLGNDLRRLVYLLSGCQLLIAPDTGPLHIARAWNVPVIGLYGHTDPRLYGPYLPEVDLCIDRYNFDAPDRPTGDSASGGRAGRMELITVDEVHDRVRMVLPQSAATAAEPRTGGNPNG